MKTRCKRFLVGLVAIVLFGCAQANGEKWLEVPSNRYVLISKSVDDANSIEYAAVKVTQQGYHADDRLSYDWLSLNAGEEIVNFQIQNFKAGRKNTVGRFGLGFENYRFAWERMEGAQQGRIKPVWHGVRGVRYCISDYSEIWGLNLRKVISDLSAQGRCL